MEQNVAWFYERRAESVVEALKKNRINASYVADPAQAAASVMALIPEGASVGMGGSVTIDRKSVV